jgi:peroxin-3
VQCAASDTRAAAPRRLHEHFDSIQRISDTTTLPSLLPALRERLYRLVDVDTLTARLIAARGAEALPPAEKYAAWEELAVLSASLPRLSPLHRGAPLRRRGLATLRPNAADAAVGCAGFARTLSAAWSVCLLDLLLRVQLNLLGSHLYLSSALGAVDAGRAPPPGVPPMPRRVAALSPASQHRYLALANYFPQEGVAAMVPRVVAACRRVLAGCVPSSHAPRRSRWMLTRFPQRAAQGDAEPRRAGRAAGPHPGGV